MRWKGPALALLGAAAVAGIAIGFMLGSGSDKTLTTGSTEAVRGSSSGGSTSAASGTAGTGASTGATLPQPPGPVRLGHRLLVATVDDAFKQADPALAARLIKISHDAGFGSVIAKGYLDLLARTYDALKAVSPHIQVIGGALAPRGSDRPGTKRDTHSPTRFIQDLGAAYKASGRSRPVMDAFSVHPYMRTSELPPTDLHTASTTITIADYPKLASLLSHAFDGTPQRGRGLPIYYTEFGVQTRVPAGHRRAYSDLDSPSAADAVDPKTQARYYRQALQLAACQPTVKGLFVFHTFDETDLAGWQSGLYYADEKPKPSLPAFRRAAADARAARLTQCSGVTFVPNS